MILELSGFDMSQTIAFYRKLGFEIILIKESR